MKIPLFCVALCATALSQTPTPDGLVSPEVHSDRTATFRVRHAGLDLFFDAYLDRLPGLAPVGLRTAEVDKADFVFVSHAHFDHLYGADAIALRTGAMVVASPAVLSLAFGLALY